MQKYKCTYIHVFQICKVADKCIRTVFIQHTSSCARVLYNTLYIHAYTYAHTYVCQRYDKRCRRGALILNNSFFRIWGQIINNSFKCVVYSSTPLYGVSGEKKFLWPKTRKVVVLLLILCFYTTSPSSLPLWLHGMEVSAA